jgi:16S rRNA (guanine(966)-N(2))-methyltransferase RsmD
MFASLFVQARTLAAMVRSRSSTAAHEVRIVGGVWRRTRLRVLDKPGLRPTPDRVRETLFNWLGQDLTGWVCLDAFAGTGALGLEAASRGAQQVVLIEQDAQLVQQLHTHVEQLKATQVKVQRTDALTALASWPAQSADLVFLDPPFSGGEAMFKHALQQAARCVPAGGWVYLEAPEAWTDEGLQTLGLSVHKHLKAGAVHAHLLQRIA